MKCSWKNLYEDIACCKKCRLANERKNAVVGMGNKVADIMLIGEGPGKNEDLQGLPFVGSAGQLLDKMLAAIGIKRDDIYIANIVKCRPPQNRTPLEDEATACLPYLRGQVALVNPRIIVCMGATAAQYVLGKDVHITRDHGKWFEVKNYHILATYHPAALLYDESKKHEAWHDLKLLRKKINELEINI